MKGSGNGSATQERAGPGAILAPGSARAAVPAGGLHRAWLSFVAFCQELRHGEIERLKIQDGLPVLAEVTKKKIKFG